MKKKNVIIPAIALSVVLSGTAIGAHSAFADEVEHVLFSTKLSERFNLNEDEVKSFMEENRIERRAHMQECFEKRLSTAVENGELTEDQKDLIIAKKSELQSEHELYRESAERPSQEEREAHREELESWAEQNDIDMKYLFGGGRGFDPLK